MPTESISCMLYEAAQKLSAYSPSAKLDAEILLAHLLHKPRAYLHAYPELELTEEMAIQYRHLLGERCAGKPIAYLTGEQEFWSLPLVVSADVLVPRADTEVLIQAALDLLPNQPLTILDMGTGSGAIAIALAHERPCWQIVAIDQSPAALTIARRNAQRYQLDNIEFIHSDWFQQLNQRRFHAILSNPPYLAAADKHLDQLMHEPKQALVAGIEGTEALSMIIHDAPNYLHEHGWLLLEHGYDQREKVIALLTARGFQRRLVYNDIGEQPRAIAACLTA